MNTCKFFKRSAGFGFPAAFLILFLFSQWAQAQHMSISYPMNRTVFQRCEYGGSRASFYVAGQCFLSGDYSLQIKITELTVSNGSTKSVYQDWTTFAFSKPSGGVFRTWVGRLPGGWYRIEIRALVGTAERAWADVKTGVGEVFLVAGQSNAQGVKSTASLSQQPYDGVVSDLHLEDCSRNIPRFPSLSPITQLSPIATQGPTNWAYTAMGNKIADRTGVPVAIFNAARFGTTVQNWEESSRGEGTAFVYRDSDWICEGVVGRDAAKGQPYLAFKNALMFYGSLFGIRGVLWHQGETDNHMDTQKDDYIDRLSKVIERSKADFGNPGLTWYIAKVSFDHTTIGIKKPDGKWFKVIEAQEMLSITNKPGPATDDLSKPRADGTHFGGDQLRALGEAWANSPLTTGSPICPTVMPSLMVTRNEDGSYRLAAQDGFSEYFWVNDDNTPIGNNVLCREQVFDRVTDLKSFRYYARTQQGTYVVSQKVYLSLPQEGARIGIEDASSEPDGIRLTVSPNPITDQGAIDLQLDRESDIRIELLNQQGQVMKVIANNHHAAGQFHYPFETSLFPSGIYHCRVKAGDRVLGKKFIKLSK